MAELTLFIGDVHSSFDDGDVIEAANSLSIGWTWANGICKRSNAGFNSDGLRHIGGLLDAYQAATCQFRCERISRTEYRKTRTSDNSSQVIERPNLQRRMKRQCQHGLHLIFGTPGREVWYSGRTRRNAEALAEVWDAIELHTPIRRTDELFQRPRNSSHTLKLHLVLTVEEYDNTRRRAFLEVLYAADGETTLKRRRRSLRWPELVPAGLHADIRNRSQVVDHRSVLITQAALEAALEVKD
jgi:hypothetical protein